MRQLLLLTAGALIAGTSIPAAQAGPVTLYFADLQPLNNSGVSGRARLELLDGNRLLVEIVASGLTPDQPHAQHIHGRFSNGATGSPVNSVTPTLANDTDGDGFIEVLEGAAAYGPVILPLSSPPAQNDDPSTQTFPTAPGGVINFRQIYDLSNEGQFFDPLAGTDYDGSDVLPLDLREIVLHGMFVEEGVGAGTDGEVNGTGGYLPVLPVAAGEIQAIPVPPAVFAAIPLFAALGGRSWLKKRLRGQRAE